MIVLPTFIFLALMTAQVSSSSTPNEQKLNLFNRGSKKRSNAAQVSLNLFNNGKKRSSEETLHRSPEPRKMIDSNNEQCTDDNMFVEGFLPDLETGISYWEKHCPGFSNRDDIVCDFQDFTSLNGKNVEDSCSELGGKPIRIEFEWYNQDLTIDQGDNYVKFSFKKIHFRNYVECVHPSCDETEVAAVYNDDSSPEPQCTSAENVFQSGFLSDFEPDKKFLKKYCPGFSKKYINIDCDFNDFTSHNGQQLEKLCSEAGGELLRIDIEYCNVHMGNFHFDRMQMNNYPQCVNPSCSEEQAATIMREESPTECGLEGQYDTFALKYNDEKTLLTQNCEWLRRQPKGKIKKICSAKKFQLYKEGKMPASRVCPETCKRFDCVAEANNAKFLAGTKYDRKSGSLVLDVLSCKQLKKLPRDMEVLCEEIPINDHILSKYGHAYEVCTSTCKSSCRSTK